MRRLESKFVLGCLLVTAWSIQIVLLIKLFHDNSSLASKNYALTGDVEQLKRNHKQLQDTFKYELLTKQNRRRSHDAYPTIQSQEQPSKLLNIFVETWNQSIGGQFYKIFGETGNEALFSQVTQLPEDKRKRILVTGGAGFVGSHLVDNLMLEGHEVIVCDNFYTGRRLNVDHWIGHPNFELLNHDIVNPLTVEVGEIYHLASPASPVHYMANPIKTLKTNTIGTINMLGLAKRNGAKILIASTSEIYGDPEVHPQAELYWGHVNPIGPRSCYDEGKRVSESLAVAYHTKENIAIRIARIFNTYGPRMHPNDGRVVSNFIIQALKNSTLTVYGTGGQTRSFQYVSDLISGLKLLMASNTSSPVNLGSDDEITVHSLARQIKLFLPNSTSYITFSKLPVDDPHRRKPDIQKARTMLAWWPSVPLSVGLTRTIEYFKQELSI